MFACLILLHMVGLGLIERYSTDRPTEAQTKIPIKRGHFLFSIEKVKINEFETMGCR